MRLLSATCKSFVRYLRQPAETASAEHQGQGTGSHRARAAPPAPAPLGNARAFENQVVAWLDRHRFWQDWHKEGRTFVSRSSSRVFHLFQGASNSLVMDW